MKYFDERIIRNKFNKPTNRMLDLWHKLSKENVGEKINVVMVDRKDVPSISQFKGELYTAWPTNDLVKNQTVLAVVVDSFNNVKEVIVSHEIGHWVLKMQGFVGLSYKSDARNHHSVLFNSMLQHPALHKLQVSLGENPQAEIDSKLENYIKVLQKQGERDSRKDRVLSALLVADDLLNTASEPLKTKMRSLLVEKHPNTLKLVDNILKTSSYYDLAKPDSNRKFAHRLLKNLKMKKSSWKEIDNVAKLIDLFKRSSDS